MNNQVTKIKAVPDLKDSVSKAVEPLGGLDRFIDQGDVVLLKPNFNTADPYPASTDLEFLKAVVELAYRAKPKIVLIGDSATMSINTREVMEKLGVFDLEKMSPAPRIYVFDERNWVEKEIAEGQYLKKVSVTQYLDRADKLILLPCLKTHFQAQFTGALKLSVGLMKPSQRVGLHVRKIQEKIADLNRIINPNLIIMDARKCFISHGPTQGQIAEPNLILASTNRVALDIEGIKIIQSFEGNSLKGIKPRELPQINEAQKALELSIDSDKE